MSADASATKRWEEEAKFFDEWANRAATNLEPVDAKVLERYGDIGTPLYTKEFQFKLIGDLQGKRILDVGCGDGEDAVILAKLGAHVTGLDVSPKAIELARRRVQIDGVEDRATFVCAPLEEARLPERFFDVIWCDNVLHHVIPTLDETMKSLLRSAKAGALVVLAEPTNLNPTLRKIRFLVPVHTEVTPGERPLERAEIDIIRNHVPGLKMRHFLFLGRLNRFVLPCGQYEKATLLQRLCVDAIALADSLVLRVPGLESLGGMGVMYGHAR